MKEEHRALLHAIAAHRGWRGYSNVIQEAIEFYLRHHSAAEEATRTLLTRKGGWSEEDVEKLKVALEELRRQWIA